MLTLRQSRMRLQEQFSGEVVTLTANTNLEARAALDRLLSDPSVTVDGLYVLSHGDSRGTQALLANESGKFQVDLSDEGSVSAVFGPLRGRLTRGARVIFNGCNTIKPGNPQEKLARMSAIADHLGVPREGELFMLAKAYLNATDQVFTQPFYGSSRAFDNVRTAFAQATAIVTYPIALGLERGVLNQGFLLHRSDTGAELHEMSLFDALSVPFTGQTPVLREQAIREATSADAPAEKQVHVKGSRSPPAQ